MGEYEYAYSYSEYLGYSDFLEEGKIGIRIKSNGKIFVFRNGKLADKGRYVYAEPIGNSIVYHFDVEEEDLKFELIDGFLVSKEFPEQYSDNFFKSTGE